MNRELADKILAKIEDEPRLYNQRQYISDDDCCGTAHCVAGWACVLGGRPDVDEVFMFDVARDLLRVDSAEATSLFAGGAIPAECLECLRTGVVFGPDGIGPDGRTREEIEHMLRAI